MDGETTALHCTQPLFLDATLYFPLKNDLDPPLSIIINLHRKRDSRKNKKFRPELVAKALICAKILILFKI